MKTNNNRSFYEVENQDELTNTSSPEKGLLTAVLERSILDYVGNNEREATRAKEWIFSDTEEDPTPFTFAWVCNELNLDPPTISKVISQMPKRGDQRIAPWYFMKKDEQLQMAASA
jgi:hypothetical protein